MAFLSFHKTKNEFIEGIKTVTRRDWKPRYLRMWQNFWDTGRLIHTGLDRDLRYGGKPIGKFDLTCRPYFEPLKDMPQEDLVAEGGMCATIEEFAHLVGKPLDESMAVIRFKKLFEG